MQLITFGRRRRVLPLLSHQLVLSMRLTAIFLLVGLMQVAAKGTAQTITFSGKNIPIEKVFSAIKKQTNYVFFYRTDDIEKAGKITVDLKDAPLEQALKTIFNGQPLTYTVVDNTIVVKLVASERVSNENLLLSNPPPIDIKGRITNENGEPVAGASVKIKGTDIGTSTNDNGEFFLNVLSPDMILVISGSNIETREESINARTNLAINVKMKNFVGEEVIINKGYYSTSRKMNTGSVARLSGTDIQKQPVSNPLAAMSGRLTGVNVVQNSGVPGGGFTVQIRGLNSLRTTGNIPLYIVDGVPFSPQSISSNSASSGIFFGVKPSALNNIDPDDIASIEVLKDADATAIYGSRGSNGVILITTKKGKAGDTKVDLNVYTGWGKVASKMDLLSTRQYLDMRYEAYKNDGIDWTKPTVSANDLKLWDTTRYTDWQKELLGGTAKITNAQLSISGGNSNTQFLFSGGYSKESTVFPGENADQKGSGRFTLSHTSQNNRFKANLSSSFLADKNNLPPTDLTTSALTLPPVAPKLYDSLGNLNWQNGTWTNPVSYTKKRYIGTTQTLISNALLSYQLFKGLQLKSTAGYTTMNLSETYTMPISAVNPATPATASAYFSNGYLHTWILEPGVEYQTTIGRGKFNALVGSTFQETISSRQTIAGTGFINDALLSNFMNAGSIFKIENPYSQYRYSAIFGRVGYDWMNKYLLNLTGRRDGSSRFGPGKQWANFGAVGMGWIFSEESFIKNNLAFLSYGKLRSSYGITGNDQIGDYGYLDTYSSTANPYNGIGGLYPSRIANSHYSWETNKKFEAALELGLFADKISLNVNWYRNRSSNQLVGYGLPLTTGFSTVQANFPATVQNTGWEFELNANIIRGRSFNWTSGINLTIPRNVLLSYPNIEASTYATTYAVGQPLYIAYVYQVAGVDPQTGAWVFRDTSGKTTSAPLDKDRRFVPSGAQDFYGGFVNSFSYKGFQLDFLFQFVKQTAANYLQLYALPSGFFNASAGNRPVNDLNRWQKAGDITNIQKFTQSAASPAFSSWLNASNSDMTISNASYIRLKNLSLSYQLPSSLLKRMKMDALRLYIQGQNLLTFTNYLGLDPESQLFALPPIKMMTVGIQITL